jgi:hypothetical protein
MSSKNLQSRVKIDLNPQKETDKGTLVSAKKFLENAGFKPC